MVPPALAVATFQVLRDGRFWMAFLSQLFTHFKSSGIRLPQALESLISFLDDDGKRIVNDFRKRNPQSTLNDVCCFLGKTLMGSDDFKAQIRGIVCDYVKDAVEIHEREHGFKKRFKKKVLFKRDQAICSMTPEQEQAVMNADFYDFDAAEYDDIERSLFGSDDAPIANGQATQMVPYVTFGQLFDGRGVNANNVTPPYPLSDNIYPVVPLNPFVPAYPNNPVNQESDMATYEDAADRMKAAAHIDQIATFPITVPTAPTESVASSNAGEINTVTAGTTLSPELNGTKRTDAAGDFGLLEKDDNSKLNEKVRNLCDGFSMGMVDAYEKQIQFVWPPGFNCFYFPDKPALAEALYEYCFPHPDDIMAFGNKINEFEGTDEIPHLVDIEVFAIGIVIRSLFAIMHLVDEDFADERLRALYLKRAITSLVRFPVDQLVHLLREDENVVRFTREAVEDAEKAIPRTFSF